MASIAASASHRSPAADLLRLAVPVVLIAGAVAGTLWIDRTNALDPPAAAVSFDVE